MMLKARTLGIEAQDYRTDRVEDGDIRRTQRRSGQEDYEAIDIPGYTLQAFASQERITLTQGGEEEVLNLAVMKGAPGPALGGAAVQGPFGGVGAVPAAGPAPTVQPSGQLMPTSNQGGPNSPAAPPLPGVTAPLPPPGSAMGTNPAARGMPDASAAPLSPEELLARRRARRTQQNQNQ